MQTPLRIAMLGPPRVTYHRDPFTVPRRHTRALLYRLAAEHEPLAREHLLFLFWPDIDDRRARRRLTLLLSQLRRALPDPEWLRATPTHVQLDPAHVWSDIIAFRDAGESRRSVHPAVLQEAVELVQGRFLEGFSVADLPEYELWLEEQRHRYARTHVEMLDRLATAYIAQQAWPLALDVARCRVALDALSETAHRNVIICYTALGNHRAARRQYDDCVAALARELGVAPQAETVALMEQIGHDSVVLRGDEASAGPGENVTPAAMPSVPALPRRTPRPVVDNLPYPLTPLIGRARELTVLETLLGASAQRLITVTGMGGMGKTHLVVTAARRAADSTQFADGVCFVPLASVTNVAELAPAILRAFGLGQGADRRDARSGEQMLLDFLRTKRLLLILDNFEHLLAGADLVHDLVRRASGVVLLVTSRLPLGLYDEHQVPLDELDYPPDHASDDTSGDLPSALARYAAVQMFVVCARRSEPSFALTQANAPAVARICRLVAGMPLAIELAAAWICTLSAAEIADEIARGIDFLAGEKGDLPARQQRVSLVLEAVWQQMAADDAALFARLSVFAGGFTRRGARALFQASMPSLRRLASAALIRYDLDASRYHIHELLRGYGAARLALNAADARDARTRHSRYFCAMVARLEPDLKDARQSAALAQLTADAANLLAAWQWAVAERDWPTLAQAMDGYGYLLAWIGNTAAAVAAFAAVTNVTASTGADAAAVQARAWAWLAYFHAPAGDVDAAATAVEICLAQLAAVEAQGVDGRMTRALALLHLGHLERGRDLDAAARAYAAGGALFTELGRAWEAACAWSWLGDAHHLIGAQDEAVALLHRARDMFVALGDQRSVGRVLETMAASLLLDRADLDAARATAAASLDLRRAGGDRAGAAESLVLLAYIDCWLNAPARAEPLLAEAFAIFRELGHRHGECRAFYVAMVLANYQGDLPRKQAMAEQGLALARQLGDAKLIGDFLRGLANVHMAQGDFATAYAMHTEAVATHARAGIRALLPWLHVVCAYSAWRMGEIADARVHLLEGLHAAAARTDTYTAVHALLFVAQILATAGNKARALELYVLAQRHSAWAGSLTGDRVFVAPLAALLQDVPPDVAARARARGDGLAFFDTVKRLEQEVARASWNWGDSNALHR